jgi:hypothetical protein
MAEWKNGGMAGLQRTVPRRMAEWRDCKERYLPSTFMVHADTDDDDDTDTF